MDKKLRAACIEAITVAACDNKWNCVLALQLKVVVEQLEETNVKSPEAAVQMFADWANSREEYEPKTNF